jgi:MinD superfamily P-loop ATPase
MKIAVFNLKGGVGKTAISLNLALDLGWGVITNESYSPIEKALPEGSFVKVGFNEQFPAVPDEMDCIFDLGGFVDERSVDVLRECSVVFIPTYVDTDPDIEVTKASIQAIEQHCKNIFIIANKCKPSDAEALQKEISYPVLTLPFSKGFKRLYTDKKSIEQQASGNKLLAYSYKNVISKFSRIKAVIK